MKFIAYITKGLEDIAAKEITRELKGSRLIKSGTKRIIFESDADYESLIKLKTIDDIAIFIDKIDLGKSHFLDAIVNKLAEIDYVEYMNILNEYRDFDNSKFSLTVSIIHYKKYHRDQIKDHLAKKISEKYKLNYLPRDHSNFDIRINIESNIAWIGIKLTPLSLFDREYRINERMGALKPTIAAAMIELATESRTNLKIVDNFCGSGTILCEALIKNHQVYGGDISEAAVKSTIENLLNLNYENTKDIINQNALETTWESKFFDSAISNLPWDKQIPVESMSQLYEGCIKEYKRIVKLGGTICLILSKPELMKIMIEKHLPRAKIKEYPIGFLGQKPTIMVIYL